MSVEPETVIKPHHQDPCRHLCTHCERDFARREHLLRHMRTHTHDFPYSCTHCSQRFKRQDVFKRHSRQFCRGQQNRNSVDSVSSLSRSRTLTACQHCRAHKVKCDGLKPCTRCVRRQQACSLAVEGIELCPNNTISIQGSDSQPAQNTGGACHERSGGKVHQEYANRRFGNQVDCLRVSINSPQNGEGSQETSPITLGNFQLDGSLNSPQLQQVTAFQHLGQGAFAPDTDTYLDLDPYAVQPQFPMNTTGHGDEPLLGGDLAQDDISTWCEDLDLFFMPNEFSDPFLLGWDNSVAFDATNQQPSGQNSAGQFQVKATSGPGTSVNTASNKTVSIEGDVTTHSSASPEPDRPSWLLEIPSTQRHFDSDIVNYFINTFMTNNAAAFQTFEALVIDEQTLPDVVLAMAAVGGLFCKLQGSFDISLALFSDARRLALGRAYSLETLTKSQEINVIQAYIALEIYGLCSGDARSFECAEAFHMQLLEVAKEFCLLDPVDLTPECDETRARCNLLNSINMLENYRVILLQRPPNWYSIIGDRDRSSSAGSIMESLLCPHLSQRGRIDHFDAVSCLSCLITLSWHTRSITNLVIGESLPPLYKRDLIELALYRWLDQVKTSHSNVESIEPWLMLLFHMTIINLHTPVKHVMNLARSRITGAKTPEDTRATLCKWRQENDSGWQQATWHAEAIIGQARAHTLGVSPVHEYVQPQVNKPFATTAHQGQQKQQLHLIEAPHVALSIYIATLVVWAAAMCQESPDMAFVRSSVDTGIHVLSRLNIRTASTLGIILRHLASSTCHYNESSL